MIHIKLYQQHRQEASREQKALKSRQAVLGRYCVPRCCFRWKATCLEARTTTLPERIMVEWMAWWSGWLTRWRVAIHGSLWLFQVIVSKRTASGFKGGLRLTRFGTPRSGQFDARGARTPLPRLKFNASLSASLLGRCFFGELLNGSTPCSTVDEQLIGMWYQKTPLLFPSFWHISGVPRVTCAPNMWS